MIGQGRDLIQSLRQVLKGHRDLGIVHIRSRAWRKIFLLMEFLKTAKTSDTQLLISDRNLNALHLLAGVTNLLSTIKTTFAPKIS